MEEFLQALEKFDGEVVWSFNRDTNCFEIRAERGTLYTTVRLTNADHFKRDRYFLAAQLACKAITATKNVRDV